MVGKLEESVRVTAEIIVYYDRDLFLGREGEDGSGEEENEEEEPFHFGMRLWEEGYRMECGCYKNNKVTVKWNYPCPNGAFLRETKISIRSVIRNENCQGKAWTHAQGREIPQKGLVYIKKDYYICGRNEK